MSDNNSDDVVEKLDKVAGSLETATSQLAGVVTQQQLDLLRERIVKIENDLTAVKESISSSSEKIDSTINLLDLSDANAKETFDEIEKDFSGLRALSLTGFALGTVTLIGLILCAVYL